MSGVLASESPPGDSDAPARRRASAARIRGKYPSETGRDLAPSDVRSAEAGAARARLGASSAFGGRSSPFVTPDDVRARAYATARSAFDRRRPRPRELLRDACMRPIRRTSVAFHDDHSSASERLPWRASGTRPAQSDVDRALIVR
ncbi:MAG TPA: hypothetical protein VGC30_14005 [Dokdonella sp.]